MKQEYDLVPIDDVDVFAIKLKGGKYDGVVYCYGGVSVEEQMEIPKLKFDYVVLHTNGMYLEDLTNDGEFHTMLGDILVEMITVEGTNDTPRNDNSEEPDSL